jgi:hypothetical protein
MNRDYVFTALPETSEPKGELWLELERSYTLRAKLLERSGDLDAITESLIADTIFELQELELRFQGDAATFEDEAVSRERARELNAELEGWLERK